MRSRLNWSKWLYSLIAATIGGAANTATAMVVDPVAFNFNDLPKLAKLLVAGAVVSMILFLKQSPLPPVKEREARLEKAISLLVFTLGLQLMWLFTGCATPGVRSTPADDAKSAARVGTVAELAAFTGTSAWLIKHPDDRKYFEASLAAVEVLAANGNASPEKLAAALAQLPIKELQGSEGTLIVGSAVILYDAYVADHVDLDANVYLRPVIDGVRNGLARALKK